MNEPRPWYREPWTWLLIALPGWAVLTGIATITLAILSDDGLVVDDYYQRGKEINRVLARDHAAEALGLTAELRLGDSSTQLELHQLANAVLPEELRLRIVNATRPGLDRSLTLRRVASALYSAALAPLPEGRWRLQLEGEGWRLVGRLQTPGHPVAALRPAID
ncbi:MAG: FixH family protein [Gammaproteobacteria bacterium]|jgi:hypothetical protein|nr:FixH family protein [Gammaproteobacteria bacterium]